MKADRGGSGTFMNEIFSMLVFIRAALIWFSRNVRGLFKQENYSIFMLTLLTGSPNQPSEHIRYLSGDSAAPQWPNLVIAAFK